VTTFHCHIATSLDGRIARPDGSVQDWLVEGGPPPEAFGFDAFYESVDAILMGRGTYEAVRGMGDWPYPGKRVLVVTSRPLPDAPAGVEARAGDLPAIVAEFEDCARVWVEGGGLLLRGMIEIGRLDRLEMAVLPIILGDGIPLFPPGTPELRLKLVHCATVAGGSLHLIYERNA
jgi:dihydrofolate reductase